MSKIKRARLNAAVSFDVLSTIDKNGHKTSNGFQYNEDWNDTRIAKLFNIEVSSVIYRREQTFGKFQRKSSNISNISSNIQTQLDNQKAQTEFLLSKISKMEQMIDLIFSGFNRLSKKPMVLKDYKELENELNKIKSLNAAN